ncbi:MAG TPA: helix-turn-helix domain-containing protein [Lacisediminihabitans sp.]|uniref:helix-turn-helix domain-containing protein n=1 Tax=Lacisediminihabitans sp. TaxID=2787631 RepID=UPI002EDB5F50
MSFTPGPDGRPEDRRRITDARALRAIAHPLRLAILHHLMAFGAQTASDCARAVGSTPSNCSYHLRSLARFGLVEALESSDGRERPWRSAATGFDFAAEAEERTGRAGETGSEARDPAAAAVERVIAESYVEEGARLARRAIAERESTPPAWRDSAVSASYALRMTPDELADLGERLDALIRPYIALTRGEAPADGEVVYLQVQGFLHPDVLG